MRGLILRLGIAIITLAAGVYMFNLWVAYHPTPVEHPPCQTCAAVYQSSLAVQTVSPCELVANFRWYENQVVRVRARVKHDEGWFGLGYGECPANIHYVQVAFDASMKSCAGVQKLLDDQLGDKHWCWKHPFGFDGSAEATIVGRFEHAGGDVDANLLRFVVLCIEEAAPTHPVYEWH